ncbi:MAG: hypothetical protein V9H26_26925 [Verrucomicrobiota bacterium]
MSAASLEEGIARLAAEAFGVILLEFFLPDGAGLANISVLEDGGAAGPHHCGGGDG